MGLVKISGFAHVAAKYGLEESIFLDSVIFWWRNNRANGRNFRDGRTWTYNTIKALSEQFPWWSEKQVRRIAESCRRQEALVTGEYNEDGRDRTIWYSPSDELLALYGEEPEGAVAEDDESICPNGQMHLPKRATGVAQTGEALPCSIHSTDTSLSPPIVPPSQPARKKRAAKTIPQYEPERFEQFWSVYPGGGSRIKAVDAWDRLRPDDALVDEMARGLHRQMHTQQWQDGVGIPHASTWLNQARWTDKLPPPKKANYGNTPPPPSGWAPDPEVMCDDL